jgi:hypothetical protein
MLLSIGFVASRIYERGEREAVLGDENKAV